jgi:hypothetical protein
MHKLRNVGAQQALNQIKRIKQHKRLKPLGN